MNKKIEDLLEEFNGFIPLKIAKERGIHRDVLERLVRERKLEKEAPGYYIRYGKFVDEFFILSQKYTTGIFSHETALYLYDYTDETPEISHMTFPKGYHHNQKFKGFAIRPHFSPKEKYFIGSSTTLTINQNTVRVYDRERTLCDMWNPRYHPDTFTKIEALKRYVKDPEKNLSNLSDYIQVLGYGKELLGQIQLLLH